VRSEVDLSVLTFDTDILIGSIAKTSRRQICTASSFHARTAAAILDPENIVERRGWLFEAICQRPRFADCIEHVWKTGVTPPI
jgi:hypothetical protein